MIADAGIDVRTAVRKRESLYGELGLADAPDDELLDAMAEHPDPDRAAVRGHRQGHPAGPPDRQGPRDLVSRRCVAVAAAAAALLTGCGEATPDYQSLLVDSPRHDPRRPPPPRTPVPLSAYLEGVGVQGRPVAPEKLTDLAVTVPRPAGLADYTNTNLAPGTRVIADGETYPTAMLHGVHPGRRLRHRRGTQACRRRRRDVGELQEAQRLSRRLQGLPVLDDRGHLRPERAAHAGLQPHRVRHRHDARQRRPGTAGPRRRNTWCS